jgi:hypothetical protein
MKFIFPKTIGKILFSIVFLSIYPIITQAQVNEIGFSLGTSMYSGEIVQHIDWLNPRPSGQLYYRANLSHVVSVKIATGFGIISSSDASYNGAVNEARDHHFTTVYNDLTVMAEYNFLDYKYNSKDDVYKLSPYATFGLGVLSYNNGINPPKGATNIGAGVPFTIPFGVGVKIRTHSNWNFQWQFIANKTFTDNLDGIYEVPNATKSFTNPKTTDWYYFTGISAGYVFYKVNCPQKMR